MTTTNNSNLDSFFNAFGEVDNSATISLSGSNSTARNAELMAAHYDNIVEVGSGTFIDFSQTPELRTPVINILTQRYHWKLEKPFFIRKMQHLQ